MLTACDMAEILETKLSRKIGSKNNNEVWLLDQGRHSIGTCIKILSDRTSSQRVLNI